jgi:hypothetical protein
MTTEKVFNGAAGLLAGAERYATSPAPRKSAAAGRKPRPHFPVSARSIRQMLEALLSRDRKGGGCLSIFPPLAGERFWRTHLTAAL